jgi:anionic cell wall polymer biosynthesis LytR-Cps2A-Psr (LCP) family protein
MLLLWKHYNYDLNNIFVKADESTTAPPATEKVEEIRYTGEYLFLAAVTSDNGEKVRFINLINVRLSDKTIKIVPVNADEKAENGKSFSAILKNDGAKALCSSVAQRYGRQIDKYAVFTDSGFKSLYRAMGEITVTVDADLEYDTEDMFLEMHRGENLLTPEKVYKYMIYLCETEKGYERSRLNAEITAASFAAFCTTEKFASADYLFSKVIDYCKTDVSVIDFTEAKPQIEYLIPKTSKEKLKVYVSSKELDD